jgi:NADH-quinone oxidoreductase subunit N
MREGRRRESYRGRSAMFRLVYGASRGTVAVDGEGGEEQSRQGARRGRRQRTRGRSRRRRYDWTGYRARGREEGRRNPGRARVKARVRRSRTGVRVVRPGYVKREGRHSYEYGRRMVFGTIGLRRRIVAEDRITRYRGREIQSLARYVLAAYQRGSAYSTEAGLKYFILGAFASARVLFGSATRYAEYGTRGYGELEVRRAGGEAGREVRRARVRIRRGLRFKRGAVPMHFWLPDVYEGSPVGSTRYFAVVPKVGMRRARERRRYGPLREQNRMWRVRTSAVRSRRRGAIVVRQQVRRKRFLAYSSIGHGGYRRAARGSETVEGVSARRRYAAVYCVRSRLTWTRRVWNRVGGKERKYVSDRTRRGEVNPRMGRTMVVVRMSMAGIPPRAGFYAKMGVMRARIQGDQVRIARVARLVSVISCYNYLRRVKIMYFESGRKRGQEEGRTYPTTERDKGTAYVCARGTRRRRRRMREPSLRTRTRVRAGVIRS